ncbi:MAG: alpha/beta hydrolase [Microthrixaceae bacterium]
MRKPLITLAALLLTSCMQSPPSGPPGSTVPPGPTDGRLYISPQPEISPTATPKNATDNVWGSAPNIDPHYGGVLYEGTAYQINSDPRPDLKDGNQPLRMWVADPNDGRTERPAIIFYHGGGFAMGVNSMASDGSMAYALDYAKRGYVVISAEYRIDTTLFGELRPNGTKPSLCQWVQDNNAPGDPTYDANLAQCSRNMEAATRDALAAVRYVHANAGSLGVNPDRIVVSGFSAGAVIASNTAYQWDNVGTSSYFPGDTLSPVDSRPNATLGASGCTFSADGEPSATIDTGDVAYSGIASLYDQAVSYDCVRHTVDRARSMGLHTEMTSYCDTALHARELYLAHKYATDLQWTHFMTRELGIYNDIEPFIPAPLC